MIEKQDPIDSFVEEIFTSGFGEKAEKLALYIESPTTWHLGHLTRQFMRDRIAALVRRADEQARADEREACAEMLELAAAQRDASMCGTMHDPAFQVTCRKNAAAIRARGEKHGTGEGGGGR